MARRGFTVIFTALGAAVAIFVVFLVLLYFIAGREPSIAAGSTLVLRVGGDLAELAPADVVGYLRGSRTPTLRSTVESLRKAKVDRRIRSVLLKPLGSTRRTGEKCRRYGMPSSTSRNPASRSMRTSSTVATASTFSPPRAIVSFSFRRAHWT